MNNFNDHRSKTVVLYGVLTQHTTIQDIGIFGRYEIVNEKSLDHHIIFQDPT